VEEGYVAGRSRFDGNGLVDHGSERGARATADLPLVADRTFEAFLPMVDQFGE